MTAPTRTPPNEGRPSRVVRRTDHVELGKLRKETAIVIGLILLVASIIGAKHAYTAHYTDGYNTGYASGVSDGRAEATCEAMQQNLKAGFKAYIAMATDPKVNIPNPQFDVLTPPPGGCGSVEVSWSSNDGQGNTLTCSRLALNAPSPEHPLPWVADTKCPSVHDAPVSVGKPIPTTTPAPSTTAKPG